MPQRICKDSRIQGQNDKSAGSHLGILTGRKYRPLIRKLTDKENRERWKTYGVKTRFKKGILPDYTPFQKGDKHIFWKGGISKRPYPFGFTKELKEEIRKRDNYKCQYCGCSQLENITALCIHHIDYNKDNISEVNLISLCVHCNIKANFNRDFWERFFTELMLKKVKVL